MTRKLLIQRLKAIVGPNDDESIGWDLAFDRKYQIPDCCIADAIVYHRNQLRRDIRRDMEELIAEL